MMLALRLALAALVLHLVLVLPSHPGALTPGALLLLPLELPLLLALLVAGRGARWRCWSWPRPAPPWAAGACLRIRPAPPLPPAI